MCGGTNGEIITEFDEKYQNGEERYLIPPHEVASLEQAIRRLAIWSDSTNQTPIDYQSLKIAHRSLCEESAR